ncbi:Hypothetical predicted protein [Octopus vulgaris]|uniref:Uncharacterized protein n=1 Tax=Octopus vulgaris TaxID=6645 RepID=A0AA36FGH6_OCTVU|nr:Hypothetical predicted protein [Octopus vulgaris]
MIQQIRRVYLPFWEFPEKQEKPESVHAVNNSIFTEERLLYCLSNKAIISQRISEQISASVPESQSLVLSLIVQNAFSK